MLIPFLDTQAEACELIFDQGKPISAPVPSRDVEMVPTIGSDIFKDTMEDSDGRIVPTSMTDFFVEQFHNCVLHSQENVDKNVGDEQRAVFLLEFLGLRLDVLKDAIYKLDEYHFGGEKCFSDDFTFMSFRRNLQRLNIMMNSPNPAGLTAGDIAQLSFYKIIINEGWLIHSKMTKHFPGQLSSWFSRLHIFLANLNKEELGALQQSPVVSEAHDAPLGKISVKTKQARHQFYSTKCEFLRRRGISDTESGTRSFGKGPAMNLDVGTSPCVVQSDWMGSVLQKQSVFREKNGDLRWGDSYSEKGTFELAFLIRALYLKYMSVPVGDIERHTLWSRIQMSPKYETFRSPSIQPNYERQWETLSTFFEKEGASSFFKNDEWFFPRDFPLSQIVSTTANSQLKSRDENRDMIFADVRNTVPRSTPLSRHVWKVRLLSQWPQDNFGFTGVFPTSIPLFNEYEYRV